MTTSSVFTADAFDKITTGVAEDAVRASLDRLDREDLVGLILDLRETTAEACEAREELGNVIVNAERSLDRILDQLDLAVSAAEDDGAEDLAEKIEDVKQLVCELFETFDV